MKKLSLLAFLFLLAGGKASSQITFEKVYEGDQDVTGRSVIQTSDGGYAICGDTEDPDLDLRYIYLIKTDTAGGLTGIAPGKDYRTFLVYPNPVRNQLRVSLPEGKNNLTIFTKKIHKY